ncbi:MAG: exodeoxyribonuclease VII small subunit [Flavobacteriales bacterium]
MSHSLSTDLPESFDSALSELRGIVTALQKPDVSIDWLTTAVQRASVLLAFCNRHLDATESEVSSLIKELGIDMESPEEDS